LFGIDIPAVMSIPQSVQKLASRFVQWETPWAKAAPEAKSKQTARYKNRRLRTEALLLAKS
jgi:hypothetical protein